MRCLKYPRMPVTSTLLDQAITPSTGNFQIPPDLVVDSWAFSVESHSTLDFLYVPDA